MQARSSSLCCPGIIATRACLTTNRAADEARYAWQHYIPHRKSDLVASASGAGEPEVVQRAQRRVSFTFRQVRGASGLQAVRSLIGGSVRV